MSTRPPLASRPEVAKYLGVPISTLNYWALKKTTGPPFIKVGRSVRYRWADVEKWLATQEQCSP